MARIITRTAAILALALGGAVGIAAGPAVAQPTSSPETVTFDCTGALSSS